MPSPLSKCCLNPHLPQPFQAHQLTEAPLGWSPSVLSVDRHVLTTRAQMAQEGLTRPHPQLSAGPQFQTGPNLPTCLSPPRAAECSGDTAGMCQPPATGTRLGDTLEAPIQRPGVRGVPAPAGNSTFSTFMVPVGLGPGKGLLTEGVEF